jgi:glucose-1-phosphate cytidylyltransferase
MNNDLTIDLGSKEKFIHHRRHNDNWRITLIDTGEESKKGTRIKMVEPYINEERFMVTYGDGVANINIKELIKYHLEQGRIATFTGVHPISRFATVETNARGEIIDWAEKKTIEERINGGFFVFERKLFDYLIGNYELEEEPMKQLAKERQVSMYSHDGFWHCMDTYRDYMILTNLWQSGEAPWKIWD